MLPDGFGLGFVTDGPTCSRCACPARYRLFRGGRLVCSAHLVTAPVEHVAFTEVY